MTINLQKELLFPAEFPRITSGILLHDERILITGHDNGYLMKWNVDTGTEEKLHECGSNIETISKSPANEILVGCNSGLFFSFPLDSPKQKTILQEPQYSKFSRVWRCAWPTDNHILQTSTYGGFYHYSKKNSDWKSVSLEGHNDSIFAVGSQNGKFFATGDYDGLIIIWEFIDGIYKSVGSIRISGGVQDISWIKDDSFATVDKLGHINVIELDSEINQWKSVYAADAATSSGTSIVVTDDGKTIFAGSRTEIIQLDLDSQELQTIDLEDTQKIFSKGNKIYALTTKGLFSFERTPIETQINLVTYRYAKVSMIGHTGVGKSTLCNLILKGVQDHLESTFGKKVWTWITPKENPTDNEQRIIFHDHGGQQSVLQTFLPFLTDSDIILILFKQTDRSTFVKAYEILNQLKSITNKQTKFFLVQTHIDNQMNDVDSKQIEILKNSNKITDCLKISSTTNKGVEDLKSRLVQEISWPNSRIMMQSEHSLGLSKTIMDLQKNDATVLSFNEFKKHYKKITQFDIPTRHLKFLLESFTSQGLIEYYSEIESIIIRDDNFERLRTDIPIMVEQHDGIISIKDIEKEFGKSQYTYILDKVFLNSNLSIKYDDLRIFPSFLKKEAIQINEPYKTFLENALIKDELLFSFQNINLKNLIKSLTELKLNCIDASTTEGIFAWQTNACVYYTISEIGNTLTGKKIKLTYFIGGKKDLIRQRLHKEFSDILTRIFGTPVSNTTQ